MKFLTTALGFASAASAHTLFTTLFVNGDNQGDGTCIRQRKDWAEATHPVYPITGDAMACGYDGQQSVPYICPTPGGSTLTFEFRKSPGGEKEGAIAEGHRGPCAVYLKKVDDMFNDSAAGDGWFKIWEDGYNQDTEKWCVDTLNENNGLLSVDLPSGLPAGYYLARPEILALHAAQDGDPQFYTNCAQIFIENGPEGPLNVPDNYSVSIPGHVNADMPGLTFNIYETPLPKYPIPGPDVYIPTSEYTDVSKKQEDGVIPKNCLIKNCNWCGTPIAKYSGESACWAGGDKCWAQSRKCWDSVQPSGNKNCAKWDAYCTKLNDECEAGNFEGPPEFTAEEFYFDVPGAIPAAYGSFDTTDVTSNDGPDDSNKSSASTVVSSAIESSTVESSAVESSVVSSVVSSSPTALASSSAKGYVASSTSSVAAAPSAEPTKDYNEDDKAEQDSDGKPSYGSGDPGLKVSEDGRCGGSTGQTCEGSAFGDCCSKKGRCGRKTRHCACGCQAGSGKCWEKLY